MRQISVCHFLLVFFSSVSANMPQLRAQNLTWTSFNFKTILTWSSVSQHTHTVEFSRVGKNRQRNPHCIQISHSDCDLTEDLHDLKAGYTADVLTELMTFDPMELPRTQSKPFCPYTDTVIGDPQFSVKLDENNTIVLNISDQQTALYRDGRHLTLRDVFKKDLKYRIIYNKAGSTGQKQTDVSDSEVLMRDLERGPSYCFKVSVFITSRRPNKKLAKWTSFKCSPALTSDLLTVFDPLVLIVGLVIMVTLLLIITVVVIYCCCRRRRDRKQTEQGEGEGEGGHVFKEG